LQAAQKWAVRPTEFFNDWSSRDQELAKSLVLHESSICRCGQPVHQSWDEDSDVEYEAVDHKCRSCAILDEANESPSSEKGIYWTVVRRDLKKGQQYDPENYEEKAD